MRKLPQIISVSSIALDKIKALCKSREVKPLGLRVSLLTKGCSGQSWDLAFVDEVNKFDEVIPLENDFKIFIDPKAMLFIIGAQMDYMDNGLEAGFIFSNPNEKGKCGCGKSFYV